MKISKNTVDQKLVFLSNLCEIKNNALLNEMDPISDVQFDELETFEHSKYKPLSVALAVQNRTRFILGFEVSQMSAKGALVKKAFAKYGPRNDKRREGLYSMLEQIKPYFADHVHFMSDDCPIYNRVVKKALKTQQYTFTQIKGGRGCITGQGEIKKLQFDPLFSINHTFAMHRYHISRLIRRTWNTTKKATNLKHHLQIYAYYHNRFLLN